MKAEKLLDFLKIIVECKESELLDLKQIIQDQIDHLKYKKISEGK